MRCVSPRKSPFALSTSTTPSSSCAEGSASYAALQEDVAIERVPWRHLHRDDAAGVTNGAARPSNRVLALFGGHVVRYSPAGARDESGGRQPPSGGPHFSLHPAAVSPARSSVRHMKARAAARPNVDRRSSTPIRPSTTKSGVTWP